MSQRRKIAREISLGRLSSEVLSMGPGLTLSEARRAFGGPDTGDTLTPPVDPPVVMEVIEPPAEPELPLEPA